ncbi:uncharacterized protein LOC135471629 [Liolophura sinensis]|uniref:uncharacterized protein LOC135471629 n=1 Tax=Liolophura sinensis TaxID=3198878 RepID=UPI0031596AE1
MVRCTGLLTLAPALIFTVLLHTGWSEGKSLSENNDDVLESVLAKRNSWWSKKSMDSISDLASDNSFHNEDSKCESSQALFGCYVDACVPQFVACARRSLSSVGFDSCKVKHRICAVRCMTEASLDDIAR